MRRAVELIEFDQPIEIYRILFGMITATGVVIGAVQESLTFEAPEGALDRGDAPEREVALLPGFISVVDPMSPIAHVGSQIIGEPVPDLLEDDRFVEADKGDQPG